MCSAAQPIEQGLQGHAICPVKCFSTNFSGHFVNETSENSVKSTTQSRINAIDACRAAVRRVAAESYNSPRCVSSPATMGGLVLPAPPMVCADLLRERS